MYLKFVLNGEDVMSGTVAGEPPPHAALVYIGERACRVVDLEYHAKATPSPVGNEPQILMVVRVLLEEVSDGGVEGVGNDGVGAEADE